MSSDTYIKTIPSNVKGILSAAEFDVKEVVLIKSVVLPIRNCAEFYSETKQHDASLSAIEKGETNIDDDEEDVDDYQRYKMLGTLFFFIFFTTLFIFILFLILQWSS
jgi:hypothetical protein